MGRAENTPSSERPMPAKADRTEIDGPLTTETAHGSRHRRHDDDRHRCGRRHRPLFMICDTPRALRNAGVPLPALLVAG
jgi:hypothetical protein